MKNHPLSTLLAIAFGLALLSGTTSAQVPPLLNYQGRVAVGTTNFHGTGQFKFLLVNAAGTTAYWTNDGTNLGPITAATQPAALVSLPVTKGLYSVLLGDTSPPLSLAPIPTSVWANADVRLRVWFNDGTNNWQLLTPDQRVAPASYLSDGSVTSAKIADTAVTSAKLAGGAVGPSQLAPNAVSSSNLLTLGIPAAGQVLSFNGTGLNWITPTTGGGGTLTLPFSQNGSSASPLFSISNSSSGSGITGSSTTGRGVYGSTATGSGTVAGVWGESSAAGGTGVVGNALANNSAGVAGVGDTANSTGVYGRGTTVGVSGNTTSGTGVSGSSASGRGVWGSSTTNRGVYGSTATGSSTVAGVWGESTAAGGTGVVGNALAINSAGVSGIGDTNGSTGVYGRGNRFGIRGVSATGSSTTAGIWGENTAAGGTGVVGNALAINSAGVSGIGDTSGSTGVYGRGTKWAGYFEGAVGIGDQYAGVRFDPNAANPGFDGPFIFGYKGGALGTVSPDAKALTWDEFNNVGIGNNLYVTGTAFVKVLTIQGADVAEPFDIAESELPKGSVVVIDGERLGGLKRSTMAYDHRVAGIVSGANGIRSGIVLSQPGVNEGGQNVALSGRVYVLADASDGPIQPGDMLTTSETPGHAMKAADHARAQGAVIGKAMSSLQEGTGMVLVLVTLQ